MKEKIGVHIYEHHEDGRFTVDGKTCWSIRFGWDEGGPESGPIFKGATDVVFADTASEAKQMWEETMGESLKNLEGWSEPYLSSRDEIEEMEEALAFLAKQVDEFAELLYNICDEDGFYDSTAVYNMPDPDED